MVVFHTEGPGHGQFVKNPTPFDFSMNLLHHRIAMDEQAQPTITEEDVIRVARLARLRLRQEDRAPMCEQLQRVMGHMAELSGVNVDGVEPTQGVVEQTPLRDDEPADCLPIQESLSAAPRSHDLGFAVPKVLDHP